MGLDDFLDGRTAAVLPYIGLFDEHDALVSPPFLLHGVYDTQVPGFEGQPLLYAATLAVSQDAIDERFRMRILPIADAVKREHPRADSTINPRHPGQYAITRTNRKTNAVLRAMYLDRPQPFSELDNLTRDDARHLLAAVGYVRLSDVVEITSDFLGDGPGRVRTTVRGLLNQYVAFAQESASDFDYAVQIHDIGIPELLEYGVLRTDMLAPNDEFTEELFSNPELDVSPDQDFPLLDILKPRSEKPRRRRSRKK